MHAQQPPAPAAPTGRGGQAGQGNQGGRAAARRDHGECAARWRGVRVLNTAFNENSRWRIHDADRPQPRVVTPPPAVGAPPSDAIVLFDGKDLSQWVQRDSSGNSATPQWRVHDGIFESGPGPSISTKEAIGDVQLHTRVCDAGDGAGHEPGSGNSGVQFMGRYEIQVLDSYNNRTYTDGMAASIYGDTPPLVNVARKPGEWQTYDIVFEAPKFSGTPSPAYFTVFWNGVMVHNRRVVQGPTSPTATTHAYPQHDRSCRWAAEPQQSRELPQHLDPAIAQVRRGSGPEEIGVIFNGGARGPPPRALPLSLPRTRSAAARPSGRRAKRVSARGWGPARTAIKDDLPVIPMTHSIGSPSASTSASWRVSRGGLSVKARTRPLIIFSPAAISAGGSSARRSSRRTSDPNM